MGPHPPLVPDELWKASVRLPEAIDANFTEILVFDLEGNKRYRPHPFKDLVNVTVLRFDDSDIDLVLCLPDFVHLFWRTERTNKWVQITHYIL